MRKMYRTTNLEEIRHALSERLLDFLERLQPALREDVVQALEEEGKLFHRPVSPLDGRWALLPFSLAGDLNVQGDMSYACGVALAVECVICSTDLFDDVMDEDGTPLVMRLGVARVLNVALSLLYLAQYILFSLVDLGMPAAQLARLLDTLQRAMLLATAGQHRDLLSERRLACTLTREECLEVAAAKAGALLALACQLGAICADVEEMRVEQCAEMGRLLGIAAQLDNDAHDLSQLLQPIPCPGQKSDLVRAKKTLPVVLAAHSLHTTSGWDATSIDAAIRNLATLTGEESAACMAALREGIVATWGIALLYRERARDCLHTITGGGAASLLLRQVLGFVEVL